MFPHYMEVAGWLALTAITLAWLSLAVYLTVFITRQSAASRSERSLWVLAIWLLPVIGVAAYLLVAARTRRSA